MESDWYFYHLNRQIHILRSSLQATHRVDYFRKASRAVLIIKRCKAAEPREGSMFAFLRCVDVHGSSHTTPLLLSRDVSGYTEPKVLGQEQPHRVAFGGEFLYSVASVICRSGGPTPIQLVSTIFFFFLCFCCSCSRTQSVKEKE